MSDIETEEESPTAITSGSSPATPRELTLDEESSAMGSRSSALYRGSPWNAYVAPLIPARDHIVMFTQPITMLQPPKRYRIPKHKLQKDCAPLPFPIHYPDSANEDKVMELMDVWAVISHSLCGQINTSRDLAKAISSYTGFKQESYTCMHSFFEEEFDELERKCFFSNILPEIIQLALKLPEEFLSPIPCLRQGRPLSLSLSQMQIAILLANAFLCTYPKDHRFRQYPSINFDGLWRASKDKRVYEKLKCIIHYFRRVVSTAPVGVVTFERKFIPSESLPKWSESRMMISDIKLRVNSQGTIEDDGIGCLQVDFANKLIGGGVLHYGCVQEEIRFSINPELIVSRLFTEELKYNEALVIIGAERYSKYAGYAESFKWGGDYKDSTPYDNYGRKRTSIVAIDARYFFSRSKQYEPIAIDRELNKAYVGFYEMAPQSASLAPVATGNWGCGAFKGNHEFKALIQIMACAQANRNLLYFTFQKKTLQCNIHHIFSIMCSAQLTVGRLYAFLRRYKYSKEYTNRQAFAFIKRCIEGSAKTNIAVFDKMRTRNILTEPDDDIVSGETPPNDDSPPHLKVSGDSDLAMDVDQSFNKTANKHLVKNSKVARDRKETSAFSSDWFLPTPDDFIVGKVVPNKDATALTESMSIDNSNEVSRQEPSPKPEAKWNSILRFRVTDSDETKTQRQTEHESCSQKFADGVYMPRTSPQSTGSSPRQPLIPSDIDIVSIHSSQHSTGSSASHGELPTDESDEPSNLDETIKPTPRKITDYFMKK